MATAEEARAAEYRRHMAAQVAARRARDVALAGSAVAYADLRARTWPRIYDLSAGVVNP